MKRRLMIGMRKDERGVALVLTIFISVVLLIFGSVFVLRAVNEKLTSERERYGVQAFYLAEAASEMAIHKIDELINTDMLSTVNITNPQTVGNKANQFVGNGDGVGFLIQFVKKGSTPQLSLVGTDGKYVQGATNLGNGSYQYDVYISEKSNPVMVATDIWEFPFYYRAQASATVKSIQKKIILTGDFTVRVQRDNFARYALFTDHHSLPNGTTVWFTDKTDFAGPIHTNERFSFALNPSGTFDGVSTQHHNQARFYNNGSPILLDAAANGTTDVPVFNASYTRGVNEIVLASSVQKADLANQAKGGQNISTDGIHVPNNGSNLTGGIYVQGDSTVQMGVDAGDNAIYTITQGATTQKITVDIPTNQTTVETVGGGTQTYAGLPNGVDELGTIIYVNGYVNSLKGTVQKDTEVTVSAENDVVITDNILYSDYTPASGTPGAPGYIPPSAEDKKNLFGVVAWGGDIRVATSAPDNVNIHGIMMARNGEFQVDDYDDQGVGSRGTATLLGGAITQFYGAFGLFNGSTGQSVSGYGRNFLYDQRTMMGKAPPYFPSMKTFIAFTNDITDKMAWEERHF
ncbi:MAG: DUF4900 domain-containing protein [Candidatus Omnitrophota bacterium]|nr:DUF4900 domain-containing protein [Candidatus Omnitrophota bacterium]MDZ4242742.1 DUF4900 domain-containing protein [Candidatus Omnitrophota bacterium]